MTTSVLKEPLFSCEKPTFANLDDKFVFMIGDHYQNECNTDFYDIAQDAWTEGPKMTNPESSMSACTLNGILYAFSG